MTHAPARPAAQPHAPLPARTGRTRPGPATRQTTLILAALPKSARAARGVLKTSLTLWGLARLTDDAEAITTELVTNAITASCAAAPPGIEPRPVTLWMTARNAELLIRVWDSDPTPPPLNQPTPDPDTEHGRGLIIVSALSHRWGWHPATNGGKYTWATLATPVNERNDIPDMAATMADTDMLISEWEASPHKAHKIAAAIARKITSANMNRYDELPLNSALAGEWDVSERTVTAAKNILGNHGILILENRRYYVALPANPDG